MNNTSKIKTRTVCRKAIRLGATKNNGNPVNYFSHFPTIRLEVGKKYKIYLDDVFVDYNELLKNAKLGTYFVTSQKYLTIDDSGSISVDATYPYRNFCVPLTKLNSKEGFLYWIKSVSNEGNTDLCEVHIARRQVEEFSCVTDSMFLQIYKGQVVGKNADNIPLILNKNIYERYYVKRRVTMRRSKEYNHIKLNYKPYKMQRVRNHKLQFGRVGLWKIEYYYKGKLVKTLYKLIQTKEINKAKNKK